MSREGKLVKNTIILAFGTFFPKLAIIVTLPILTAFLTQTEYGTYDLVLTLVALILPAATLQIHSAAFRYLIDVQHDEAEKKSIITNIYGFVLPTSFIALLILFFALAGQPVYIRLAICAYFLFDMLVNANRQIIRGLGRNVDYALSSFISALGQILLTVLLVFVIKGALLGGLIALATAELIATAHLMFFGGIYKYIDLKTLNFAKTKELLSYSWPMVPNSLSQWVMHASDRLVITAFLGLSANAVFAVAYKIPSILSFAQATFNMAWQENASIASKDEDAPKYYSTMFEWLFDIVAGCMAILVGITPLLFEILIKGDYAEAYNHIPILYLGMFFFTLSSFWGGIFVAYKKTKIIGFTTLIAAVIHLVIVLSLIHFWGIYAASAATLISYIVLCLMRLLGVRKIVNIRYKWGHIGIVCALLFAQCAMTYFDNIVVVILNFVIGLAFGIILNRNLIKSILGKVMSVIKKLKAKKA